MKKTYTFLFVLFSSLTFFIHSSLLANESTMGAFFVNELEITTDKPPFLCEGEEITLTVETALTADSIVWKWDPDGMVDDVNAMEITLTPEPGTTIVNLEFYSGGELFEQSIAIETDPFVVPVLTTLDTTICQGESIVLAAADSEATVDYQWEPDTFFTSDLTIVNAEVRPQESITYTLTATSQNEYCTFIDSVIIEVLPNEVEILHPDTTGVCDDDPEIVLNTRFEPPGSEFVWRPNNGSLSDLNTSSPTATLDFSTRYIVTMTTPDGCVSMDTVVVRLDSLPEFNYAVVPDPDPDCNKYCPGEFVTIFSNPVNPERFPDIEYLWEPMDGSIQDSLHFQNIGIETSVSQYYIRENINNGCRGMDSVWIDVVDPEIPINLRDTVVCANQPVQIEIDDTNLTDIEWSPEEGLSCTDCPNPVITTPETRTFTVTATAEECCPASTTVTVNVFYPTIPIEPAMACPGEPVEIVVDSEGFTNPNWVSNEEFLSCTNCFDPLATVNSDTEFILQALDEDGCLSLGQTVVTVYPNPDIMEIEVEPGDEIPIGSVGTFRLNVIPMVDADNITWFYNGEEVESGSRTAAITILEEGEANVIEVVFLDANGCMRSLQVIISGIEPIFEVPNVFSPGGQSMYPFFRPVVVNADQFDGSFVSDFKIFNRWGEKVYDNDNNEEGWDGRQGGTPAPSDVYVYIIEIKLPNGNTRTLKGDVTLLR